MEKERQKDNPNSTISMADIEDQLRKKINLSSDEWQALVATSNGVDGSTQEATKQARTFADQDRALRKQNPLTANSPATGRAVLRKMQADLDARVITDINKLEATVGPDCIARIQSYLNGPLAASAHVVHLGIHKGVQQ